MTARKRGAERASTASIVASDDAASSDEEIIYVPPGLVGPIFIPSTLDLGDQGDSDEEDEEIILVPESWRQGNTTPAPHGSFPSERASAHTGPSSSGPSSSASMHFDPSRLPAGSALGVESAHSLAERMQNRTAVEYKSKQGSYSRSHEKGKQEGQSYAKTAYDHKQKIDTGTLGRLCPPNCEFGQKCDVSEALAPQCAVLVPSPARSAR